MAKAGPWAIQRGPYPNSWYLLLDVWKLQGFDRREMLNRIDDVTTKAMRTLGKMAHGDKQREDAKKKETEELDMYITSYCIRNRKMDRIEYLTKKSLHKKRKWVKHMRGKEPRLPALHRYPIN